MSGHTPGPWRWLGNHSLVGDHGRRPAVMTARELKQRNPETGLLVDLDPESPDARLIAAAPDLLAACEAALRYLDSDADENGPDRWLVLRNAIAKARGE